MDAEDGLEEILILRDPKWLCESLINVLDNAVKYSPVGSTVTIRAATTVSFLRLEVKDEGIGIPRENYHKVFQRFYRGEAPLVRRRFRVGLYLARRIIEESQRYDFFGCTQDDKGTGVPCLAYSFRSSKEVLQNCKAFFILKGK